MRFPLAPAAFAVAFVLAPVVSGYAPALSQDFSITNPVEPGDPGRRDLMRQLQAWWNVHGYYPKHASNNDEGGTVKVHLEILPDGRIWAATVAESSKSPSLDAAATAVFRGGFVRPMPEGSQEVDLDLSLHYVLAHRHDQPVAAGYTPVASKRNFTITNDPVKSVILETMLQRTCTGTINTQGIRNHPIYGVRYYGAKLIFFRRPDGTPWVKFYEGGYIGLSPLVEVGNLVSWTGPLQRLGGGGYSSRQYTVWPDGENKLDGNVKIDNTGLATPDSPNTGGTLSFTCETEVVPQIEWSGWYVTPAVNPPGDPD